MIQSTPLLTVLPSQRHLDQYIAARMHNSDLNVQLANDVELLSRWVDEILARASVLSGQPSPASASPLRLQMTWERAVANAPPVGVRPALDPRAVRVVAGMARNTDRLCTQWQIPHEQLGGTTAGNRLLGWRKEVGTGLESAGYSSPEGQLGRLIRLLDSKLPFGLKLPEHIEFVGFRETTAQELGLISALKSNGVSISRPDVRSIAKERQRLLASSLPRELAAAARWAHERARDGSRVAIVINDLAALRPMVQDAFDRVFCPHELLAKNGASKEDEKGQTPSGYHLSQGAPLSGHPLVRAALALLQQSRLGRSVPQPFHNISELLLGQFWQGAGAERAARSRLELLARRDGRFQWSLVELLELARSTGLITQLPQLQRCFEAVDREPWSGNRAAEAIEHLARWGWPGPAASNHTARPVTGAVVEKLDALGAAGVRDVDAFLTRLTSLLAESQLPGRGGVLSPVQILTPEDAFGLRFDAARILNLRSDNWPPGAHHDPFLPSGVNAQLPRGDEQAALRESEAMTNDLLKLAPVVCFSTSTQNNGETFVPSPVVQQIVGDTPTPISEQQLPASSGEVVFPDCMSLNGYLGHPWLQELADVTGAAMTVGGDVVRGGSGFLREQASNPLAAYCVRRLGARFQEPPTQFPDRLWWGNMIHRSLERLYRPHEGKDSLPHASDIGPAVEATLTGSGAVHRMTGAMLSAQRRCLEEALSDWLDNESARAPFAIGNIEWRQQWAVSGLQFDLRVDRVDRLDDGTLLVIDYKSGTLPAAKHLVGERLVEPQLPLYTVMVDEQAQGSVSAAALARVKRGGVAWCGLASEEHVQKGFLARPPELWGDLMTHWRHGLEALVGEIATGVCVNQTWHKKGIGYLNLELLIRPAEGAAWRLVNHESAN